MINLILISLFLSSLFSYVFLFASYLDVSSKQKYPRACKRIGRSQEATSNSWGNIRRDISRTLWRQRQDKQSPVVGIVENLYVHPIKSCKAVGMEEAEVLSAGFKHDRKFTFAEFREAPEAGAVSSKTQPGGWHFVTQRKYGKLANIRVDIWVPDPESLEYAPGEPNVQSDGVLVVRYPDLDQGTRKYEVQRSFELPFHPTKSQIVNQGYTMEKLTVWKDCPESLLITSTNRADSPPWIKDIQAYIGCSKPFALFRVATGHDRQVFRNAPRKEELGYQSVVGFADSYPLHILGLASVADLDHRLTHVIPRFSTSTAPRFRANIYFKGPSAYAEDSWKRIRIGQQIYYVACRTTRCELPNTDQYTGTKHRSEPSKTMKSYRDIDPGAGPGRACLGMQMVPAAEQGTIKVGDGIEILETGEHYYILQ